MKRNGAARRSSGSRGRGDRSGRLRGSRDPGGRRLDEEVDRNEAQRRADMGLVEWGGELIWAVAFTPGGAAIGLRACELDPLDLQAMGLDVAALDVEALATAESWIDGLDAWLEDDDLG